MREKCIFRQGLLAVLFCLIIFWGMQPGKIYAAAKVNLKSGNEYYLISAAYPGKAVNVSVDSNASITNKTKVNLYKLDKTETQRFTFQKNNKGNYLMIPLGSKYTVNVSKLSSGTSIFTWQNKKANNEYFIIEQSGDGYYTLRMENKSSLYLTSSSGSTLTLKAKASSGNSQKFIIVDYTAEQSNKTDTPSETGSPSVTGKAVLKLAVPTIRQTNKKWKNKEFVKGASPKCTIGSYGCLMTSVTAVMSYYDGVTYQPDQYYRRRDSVLKFKQVLPKTGKYKKWSLKKRSKDAGNMKNIKGWINGVPYKLKTVKAQLKKGNPVIVGGKGKSGWHYVVVYGFKNNGAKASDYYIMDPSNLSRNLQQHINKFGKTMYYKK